ncbi:MAG: CoA transferase [Actinomycetia bacterium]|nr:CoA transferase [Actinomycetes bacterium]
MTSAPLDGVCVIEFGHYIAAPAATQIMADLGADVVKVEPPSGDQARSIGAYGEGIVCAYNRGKRSVVLDLKDSEQCDAALDLVASADVVVQNLRAGVMERLGLGVDRLTAANPHLIHVAISGFSPKGDSAERAGLDIAAQAESGLMSITGEQGGDPQRVGFPIADVGASYAVVQVVLAALFRRERTGEGGHAEVSLVDVAIHMQSALWGEWHTSGTEPRRKGNGQATVAPAADLVTTADGQIVLSAYTTEHFSRLCTFLEKPWMIDDTRFADNRARVIHRTRLLAEISEVLRQFTTEECVARLGRLGLVAAAVRTFADVKAAPDTVASEVFVTARDLAGREYMVPGLPFGLDGVTAQADLAVVDVGADTEAVRGT